MIIIDTNIFMEKFDIFNELKKYDKNLAVLSSTLEELKKISNGSSESARKAKIALTLIEANKINIIKAEEVGDKAILNFARKHKCKVATNDKKLIKTLKRNNIKIIRTRQKKFFIEE